MFFSNWQVFSEKLDFVQKSVAQLGCMNYTLSGKPFLSCKTALGISVIFPIHKGASVNGKSSFPLTFKVYGYTCWGSKSCLKEIASIF